MVKVLMMKLKALKLSFSEKLSNKVWFMGNEKKNNW